MAPTVALRRLLVNAARPEPTEPVREKRFSFSWQEPGGRLLEGVLLYRRPTVRDLLRIEAERARLCEGQSLDPEWQILAGMLAQLKVVLREVPPWLRWDELEDVGLVTRLYEEVARIDGAWFRRDDGAAGGAGAGAAAGPRADDAVPAAPVVGPEVRPAAHQR